MRKLLQLAAIIGGLLLAASISHAQESWFERQFSADMTMSHPGMPEQQGTLFVGEQAMRMEIVEAGQELVMLFEFLEDDLVVRVIMPGERMYVQMTVDVTEFLAADEADMLFAVTAPDHPNHPCQTAPERVQCALVGTEQIEGVTAERWEIEVTDELGDAWHQTLWVDRDEDVVVRLEDEDGTVVQFRNYEFGTQPEELFEVPEGYQRFELPPGMQLPGN